MREFMLIGEQLSHSYSAPIHQMFFHLQGIEASYQLQEFSPTAFKGIKEPLLRFVGANVTIPYKQAVIPQLDELAPCAKQIGAVNTVQNLNGRLIGHNTDIGGFAAMLNHHRFHVQGQPCAILGAGGASKAAVAALENLGAADIKVFSRTPDEKTGTHGYGELYAYHGGLLVNCTPVGMYPHPDACPVAKDIIAHFDEGADMIYNPSVTLFAKSFKKSATGLYMLVAQAALAQEIWFQTPIEKSLVDAVYQAMLKEFA